jgi:hypothetical protein
MKTKTVEAIQTQRPIEGYQAAEEYKGGESQNTPQRSPVTSLTVTFSNPV